MIMTFVYLFCFYLFILVFYWNLIALQCYISFCCTTTSISYLDTYIPALLDLAPCTLHLSLCSQEDPADMLDDLKSHGDAPFPCTNLTLQSVTVLLLRQRVLVLRVMNPQRDSVHGGYSLRGWSLFSR